MANPPSILAFAGSTREGSFNKKLIRVAARLAEAAGAKVTLLDLRDLALPLYDGDLEQQSGLPDGALRLKKLMKEHDAFLIASAEYNSSVSAVLKNAIDWASRPQGDDRPLQAFAGKVAGLMAASTGALGGLRGLVHLRAILGNINVLVVPEQFALAKANEAFNEDGSLKDDAPKQAVEKIVRRVVDLAARLKS
ncbi:MAG TPA: NAD(P)H-dependent oxidoreductase [Phycisphaerales bacterium]|nr:NAD(P)H-dependent oxidoreductase [Phycisphaerales bacterium]